MKTHYYFEINRRAELTAKEERNARRGDRRMCRTYHLIMKNVIRYRMQEADGYKIAKRDR